MNLPDPDQSITLTKSVAAMRQTHLAIGALANGDFDAAITLAGAAEELLPEKPDQKVFGTLRDDPSGQEMFGRKQWIELINVERNWLKHQTTTFGEELTISAADAAFMIVRAMARLPKWSDEMHLFKDWFFGKVLERHSGSNLEP